MTADAVFHSSYQPGIGNGEQSLNTDTASIKAFWKSTGYHDDIVSSSCITKWFLILMQSINQAVSRVIKGKATSGAVMYYSVQNV